ncbi:pyrroline-5-carboxylate reductase 2-like [Mytilus californianus]|uniref:pyrroline-5-carboxylate reductase 2-like n=1 Tax=Mytilus californianus TaxID=6549 RepID=UPI0022450503|nr:pyrroline-5-carboxylate reductase 2-like [Mytilus californianus]
MAIGFIGAGRMAQAMARGFIATGVIKSQNIIASDPDPRMLKFLKNHGITTTLENTEVVDRSKMIVIAVKPNVVSKVLKEVKDHVTMDKIMVSIVAGVPLSILEENLPPDTRVVRVMSNIPVTVQAAASVISLGAGALPDDSELVRELLQCIGICEEGSESLLDAVTGLSGSGPAYAFTAIESLADGGVKMGLPRDLAIKLAAQTLLGAAKMVLESGKHVGQLKDEVCSPGGTTIAAMHSLERAGFRASLINAVEIGTLKARELGSQKKKESLEVNDSPATSVAEN